MGIRSLTGTSLASSNGVSSTGVPEHGVTPRRGWNVPKSKQSVVAPIKLLHLRLHASCTGAQGSSCGSQSGHEWLMEPKNGRERPSPLVPLPGPTGRKGYRSVGWNRADVITAPWVPRFLDPSSSPESSACRVQVPVDACTCAVSVRRTDCVHTYRVYGGVTFATAQS